MEIDPNADIILNPDHVGTIVGFTCRHCSYPPAPTPAAAPVPVLPGKYQDQTTHESISEKRLSVVIKAEQDWRQRADDGNAEA
jgi:hypothetical protein